MHHASKQPGKKTFEFANEDEYAIALKDGWVFDPSDLKKKPEVSTEVKDVIAQEVDKQLNKEEPDLQKEVHIHRPETPEEPLLKVNEPVKEEKVKLSKYAKKMMKKKGL
jgi:hypothetical protein